MAFAEIIALNDFQKQLKMAEITFELRVNGSSQTYGDGEDIFSSSAPATWGGMITLAPEYHVDSEAQLGLLQRMNRSGQAFALTPPHINTLNDPDGQIYSSSAANLISIGALSAGAILPKGTFFSITWGSPAKYFLHKTLEAATADGTGNTPEIEIEPPLETGWSIGDVVRMDEPIVKAKLKGGGLSHPSIRPLISSGTSFEWVQTFR